MKFDVSKKTPIFTFLKHTQKSLNKKLERFDVYKKLRHFPLLQRNREKFKMIIAISSCTGWCAFRKRKKNKKAKSNFFSYKFKWSARESSKILEREVEQKYVTKV